MYGVRITVLWILIGTNLILARSAMLFNTPTGACLGTCNIAGGGAAGACANCQQKEYMSGATNGEMFYQAAQNIIQEEEANKNARKQEEVQAQENCNENWQNPHQLMEGVDVRVKPQKKNKSSLASIRKREACYQGLISKGKRIMKNGFMALSRAETMAKAKKGQRYVHLLDTMCSECFERNVVMDFLNKQKWLAMVAKNAGELRADEDVAMIVVYENLKRRSKRKLACCITFFPSSSIMTGQNAMGRLLTVKGVPSAAFMEKMSKCKASCNAKQGNGLATVESEGASSKCEESCRQSPIAKLLDLSTIQAESDQPTEKRSKREDITGGMRARG